MSSNFQFLAPDSVVETFKTSRQYTESLTDLSFIEYERIARNKPHPSIPKEYPKTTDGTTASIIRKTPHRIIQQIPTGTVRSDKEDWLALVASFIYTHKIIPNANEGYALLQKCWGVIERSMTFGYCATYVPFTQRNGYFCTDLRLPYWGDIFIQPGKLSDADSNYIFMRSWWQTKDIEALIDSQNKLSKDARTWNTDNLKKVKDFQSTKDNKASTPVEREKSINTKGGVELITGFQRGKGAKFYTFHVSSGLILRTKENKDPRGELPVSFAYGDIDGANPFGRSVIELIGSIQNLMDGEMQMYQYNRALQLNPPLIKRGAFSKNKIKFVPNHIIDVGSQDATIANVEPLKIDTTALENFPNNYSLMKSQLLNLVSSPDTSISATVGNPGFSKTPQGVNATQATVSVDDNYIRKQFETWFERWSETAINLYFAERSGIEELQLNDDTAEALRALDDFDQSLLSDDNKIRINYDTATPALKFEVDASSSQMKNDPMQQQIATSLLDTVMKYPMLNSNWGGPIDVDELARKIVTASAIADPQLIAPEPTKAQKQAKEDSKQKPNGFSPMFDKPKIEIRYPDIPPSAQIQMLGLAGIQVTMQDVLEGPVVDPNERNTINPINDPNLLVPGGGPFTQSPSQFGGGQSGQPGLPNPLQQDGVNLSPQEIQRLQQDPRFAQAQQAQQPDPTAALKQQAYSVQQPPQAAPPPPDTSLQTTPEHVLKAHDMTHQHEMDKAKLLLEAAKVHQAGQQADQSHQLAIKQANKPQPAAKPAAKPASKPKGTKK